MTEPKELADEDLIAEVRRWTVYDHLECDIAWHIAIAKELAARLEAALEREKELGRRLYAARENRR